MAIDEERTVEIYGYTSDELAPKSRKTIVAVCEECGKYRDLKKQDYRKLCISCAMKKRYEDPTFCEKVSNAQKKRYEDPLERKKSSKAANKRWEDPSEIKKISGENNHNWLGGISLGNYCPKFNDEIRQYIRDKYNNCDYISGIHKDICNPGRELDVHHIDYNKDQGCNEHEWRLIPLSQTNHVRTNFARSFWNRLFTYSLQYYETYYENGPTDVWRTL